MNYKMRWMIVLLNIKYRTASAMCKKIDLTHSHCYKLLYDMCDKKWLKQVPGVNKRERAFALTAKGKKVFDACYIVDGYLNEFEMANEKDNEKDKKK